MVVFFVEDYHSELLEQLDKNGKFFHSTAVSIVKRQKWLNLTIQFNTKIILYKETSTAITLEEDFRIKGGPITTKKESDSAKRLPFLPSACQRS
jgi:hypothetical protein